MNFIIGRLNPKDAGELTLQAYSEVEIPVHYVRANSPCWIMIEHEFLSLHVFFGFFFEEEEEEETTHNHSVLWTMAS